jgi:hypothetical protein
LNALAILSRLGQKFDSLPLPSVILPHGFFIHQRLNDWFWNYGHILGQISNVRAAHQGVGLPSNGGRPRVSRVAIIVRLHDDNAQAMPVRVCFNHKEPEPTSIGNRRAEQAELITRTL